MPSMPAAAPRIFVLRPIRPADDASMAAIIRSVMTEHGCTGAGFAIHDAEVTSMSRAYAAADAGYFVVEHAGSVLGGAGFARLQGSTPAEATCELRKMYFLAAARGVGAGRVMLETLLAEMRRCGYRRCYLETTSWMHAARALYERAGFEPLAAPLGATGHHACDRFFARQL